MKPLITLSIIIFVTMSTASQNYKPLEDYLENKIVEKTSPGVQFLIADSSGILFEFNKGTANIESEIKVDSQTQFKMYSSTKLLTMMSIMQLVERGKIDLESPLSTYIPYDFPAEVTIRRVLSHTAGFSKYPFIKEIHLASEDDGFDYADFMADMLPKHKGLKYKPGRKNSYSNYGFLALSAVVEVVSGMPYTTYVQEHVIQRANLSPEDYVGFEYTRHTATGYQKRGTMMHWLYSMMVDTDTYYGHKTKQWQAYQDLYMEGLGFGGGFANAQGLSQLFVALLKHDILEENTLNLTYAPQTYNGGKVSKQTLGWWKGESNALPCYHHAGGGGGYSCEVRVYPETGIVRIMMMNKTQTINDLKMFSKIDELWLD